MTLDKHSIQGLAAFTTKTLSSNEFQKRMLNAGYFEVGSAPGLLIIVPKKFVVFWTQVGNGDVKLITPTTVTHLGWLKLYFLLLVDHLNKISLSNCSHQTSD